MRYFEQRSYKELDERMAITEPADAGRGSSRALTANRPISGGAPARRSPFGGGDAGLVAKQRGRGAQHAGFSGAGIAVKGTAISARHLAIAKETMLGMMPRG